MAVISFVIFSNLAFPSAVLSFLSSCHCLICDAAMFMRLLLLFMSLNSLLSFEPFTHDSSVSIISIGSPSFTAGMFLMPRCCGYPMPRMASFGACPSMVNFPPETLAVDIGFLWLPLTNTTTVFTVSGTVPLTLNVTS